MDTSNGNIGTLEELYKKGSKEKDLIPLTESEKAMLETKTPEERIHWATELHKKKEAK